VALVEENPCVKLPYRRATDIGLAHLGESYHGWKIVIAVGKFG
jgi:hypothetical protein